MKHFIRIAALLIAVCTLFGMTSCDVIFGELENIIDVLEEDGIGGVLDDVSDALGKTEVMIDFDGSYTSMQIDNKMMSYFFNNHLANWFTTYSSYVDMFGLDVNKDLDDQMFGNGSPMLTMILGNFDGTWQEYFYYRAVEEVKMYIIWADYAQSYGITLDEADHIDIEKCINEENERLEKSGTKYKDWYGKGVDEEVIRRCLELTYLAAKGSDHYMKSVEKDITYGELKSWADNNREDVLVADCLSYTITVSSQNMDYMDYDSLCEEARMAAQTIRDSRTADEFERNASAVASMGYKFDTPSKVAAETISYSTESEAAKWIFENGVETGDTNIFENRNNVNGNGSEKENYTSYETFSITVYFVTKAAYLDERLAHSVAYAILSSEDAARAIREEVISYGVTDGVEFMSIANRYASQYGKSGQNATNILSTVQPDEYLYVENMKSGYFSDNYQALNEWIEDEGRQAGDVSDVIRIENNKYSYISGGNTGVYNGSFSIGGTVTQIGSNKYAVALFVDHGDEVWKATALSALVAERVSYTYDELMYGSGWMISGNYERISVANLSLLRSQNSSGILINYSGVNSGVTFAPEYSDGIKYFPGDVEYSYTIIDPDNFTFVPGDFEYGYIITDPNYTVITPTPSQPEKGAE